MNSVFISFCIVLLAGCGFTLRGSVDLPPELQTLSLANPNDNSDIKREVRRALLANRINLVEDAQSERYALAVGNEQGSERILSVNSNARAGEYELTMSVTWQLLSQQDVVFGPEIISLDKVYLADPNNAVAKNEEAELIREEMRRELAIQILRRLQSLQL